MFINACRLLPTLPSLSQFGRGRLSLVAISFYALSLLFGPCRLSEFTLAGPHISLLLPGSDCDNFLKQATMYVNEKGIGLSVHPLYLLNDGHKVILQKPQFQGYCHHNVLHTCTLVSFCLACVVSKCFHVSLSRKFIQLSHNNWIKNTCYISYLFLG